MIFIETPTFEADREEHFRIAQPGRGKSGGGRVIYYWRTAENQILLVAVFAKNVKVNLTPAEVKALAKAYAG